MRKCVVFLCALAACGGSGPGKVASTRTITPAQGCAALLLLAEGGDIEFHTGDTGHVVIDGAAGLKIEPRDGVLRLVHGRGNLKITAPEGFRLTARVERGTLGVTGKWGRLALTTPNGDVRIDATMQGAKVEATQGDIDLTCRNAPAESVDVTATGGAIRFRISPAFRGIAQLSGAEIDLPADKRLTVRRSEGSATVFVGERFTRKDHEEMPVDKRPGLWARARTKIDFALTDAP